MTESPKPNEYTINTRDIPKEVLDWLRLKGIPLEGEVTISFVPENQSLDASYPVGDALTSVREAVESAINDPIELLFIKKPEEVSADVMRKLGLADGFAYEITTPQPRVLGRDFPGFVIHFGRFKDKVYQPMDVYLDDKRTDNHPRSELDNFMSDTYTDLCSKEGWEQVDMNKELAKHSHGASLYQAFLNIGRQSWGKQCTLEVFKKNGFYLIFNPELLKRVLISENSPLLRELYTGNFANLADQIMKGDTTGGYCFGMKHDPDWGKIYEVLGLVRDEDGAVRYKT